MPSSQSHHGPFGPTRSLEVAGGDRAVVADPLEDLVEELSDGRGRSRGHAPATGGRLSIRQRNRRWWALGTMAAMWAQYSNSSPSSSASGSSVRGCGPRRANSGSSWLRTSTLTESIWMTPMRSKTLPQVAAVDAAGRARVGEALGGDRHAPRLVGRSASTGLARPSLAQAERRPRRLAEARSTASRTGATGVVVGDVHRQRQVPAWAR